MAELWYLLPVWLKWVVLVSGWLVLTIQRVWRRLPANLYVFGLSIHRGSREGSIGTKKRRWVSWDDRAGAPNSATCDNTRASTDQPDRE